MEEFGITGLGGIFFKSQNPEETMAWYRAMLNVQTDGQYGATFRWRSFGQPSETGSTVWSPFPDNSDYFEPSVKTFMVNLRVKSLETLLQHLSENGVKQVGEMQVFEYGKFAWILDPDGTKIELWEPNDPAFGETTEGNTHPT